MSLLTAQWLREFLNEKYENPDPFNCVIIQFSSQCHIQMDKVLFCAYSKLFQSQVQDEEVLICAQEFDIKIGEILKKILYFR